MNVSKLLFSLVLIASLSASSSSAMLRDGKYSVMTKGGWRTATVTDSEAHWSFGGNSGKITNERCLSQLFRLSDERSFADDITERQNYQEGWLKKHSKLLVIGGTVVMILCVGGYYLYKMCTENSADIAQNSQNITTLNATVTSLGATVTKQSSAITIFAQYLKAKAASWNPFF